MNTGNGRETVYEAKILVERIPSKGSTEKAPEVKNDRVFIACELQLDHDVSARSKIFVRHEFTSAVVSDSTRYISK